MKLADNVCSIFVDMIQTHKTGRTNGFYAVHSRHPFVLRAAMRQALVDQTSLIVEMTGWPQDSSGYKRPAAFAAYIKKLACDTDFPIEKLILGGGQVDEEIWCSEPIDQAMHKANNWVAECVDVGFTKIYLDAGMACETENTGGNVDIQFVAEKQAALCRIAEKASKKSNAQTNQLCYVLSVPSAEAVAEIWDTTKSVFNAAGLEYAWQRVVALAVQPATGFEDYAITPYQQESGIKLKELCEKHNQFVYEVRSADYQPEWALRQMVADHFSILGIGPSLTFAMRETLFSLAMLENEWLIGKPGARLSNLIVELDKAMQLAPYAWKGRIGSNGFDQLLARKYSYQDLSRFYWQENDVRVALKKLMKNLNQDPPPLPLLKQFLPDLYEQVRDGKVENRPEDLVLHRIQSALKPFSQACGNTGDVNE